MISQLDQECADAIAALHRWLALQLQKIIAARPPSAGPVNTDHMVQLKVDTQAALNWLHLYLEALKAALQQERESNLLAHPDGK
jgi:hypothetical protein